jgi:hypothetical protein
MSREMFALVVSILYDIESGYYNCSGCHTQYREGFFLSLELWCVGAYNEYPDSDFDTFDQQAGFREVVDEFQDGIAENMSDEWERGYRDGILLFRVVKGL